MVIKKLFITNSLVTTMIILITYNGFYHANYNIYSYYLLVILLNGVLLKEYINYSLGSFDKIIIVPLLLLIGMIMYATFAKVLGQNVTPVFAIISLLYFLSAIWISKQNEQLVCKSAFISLMLYYVFFIVSGLEKGFAPYEINEYLENSSVNGVSALALIFQIFYSTSYYKLHKKLPYITPLITMVICIMAFGRSGIAVSVLILLLTFFVNYKHYKILNSFFLVSLIVLFLFLFQELLQFFEHYTNFGRGLESPRQEMLNDYLSVVNFISFFTGGINLLSIPSISIHDGNPHNAYIYSHAGLGILYLMFIVSIWLYVFYIFTFYKNTLVYFSFLMLFSIRFFFDTGSLFGASDFLFYYLLICLYKEKKEFNFRFKFIRSHSWKLNKVNSIH